MPRHSYRVPPSHPSFGSISSGSLSSELLGPLELARSSSGYPTGAHRPACHLIEATILWNRYGDRKRLGSSAGGSEYRPFSPLSATFQGVPDTGSISCPNTGASSSSVFPSSCGADMVFSSIPASCSILFVPVYFARAGTSFTYAQRSSLVSQGNTRAGLRSPSQDIRPSCAPLVS